MGVRSDISKFICEANTIIVHCALSIVHLCRHDQLEFIKIWASRLGRPFFLAAAAVVVAAATVVATAAAVAAPQTVAATAAGEQNDQDDDPPAVVIAHKSTSKNFIKQLRCRSFHGIPTGEKCSFQGQQP